MRVFRLATAVALMALLVPHAASHADDAPGTETDPGAPADTLEFRVYGYALVNDDVVFVFSPDIFGVATRGDNGWPVAVVDIDIGTVAVAGEFNGWSTDAWPMAETDGGTYQLTRPIEELKGRESWQFKFVIDGFYWVEPPADAENAPRTGFSNASRNLILWIEKPESAAQAKPTDGRATPQSAEQLADELPELAALTLPSEDESGCRIKAALRSYGAPVGPATMNPMITTDRKTIGFVSSFIAPPTEEEVAELEQLGGHRGREVAEEKMRAWFDERLPGVLAAYTCVYHSASPADETGVYALLFDEAVPETFREKLESCVPEEAMILGKRVAGIVWTDDDDTSCLEAVREHARSVLSD